jgi:predicted signal transduction protein with EAL and GGDEF domain
LAKAVDDTSKSGFAITASLPGRQRRDDLMLGIIFSAIILFVGTGGSIMHQAVDSWLNHKPPPDMILSSALMLNIALMLLGWSRYRKLQEEVVLTRQSEEQAQMLAMLDPLTSCLNRRSGTPAIEALLQQAQGNKKFVCLLVIG